MTGLKNLDDIYIQFGKVLRKFMTHYGISESDVANLISSNTNDINDIIAGKKGIVLKTAGKIASIFGLTYYEFGNSKTKYPTITELPLITQQTIKSRKENTRNPRNQKLDIAGNLDKILFETEFLHELRSADEIFKQLPQEIANAISPGRITDLLSKNPRAKMLNKLKGKEWGGKGNKYVLKTYYEPKEK